MLWPWKIASRSFQSSRKSEWGRGRIRLAGGVGMLRVGVEEVCVDRLGY